MSKPSNWDSMSEEEKKELAFNFYPSTRAQLMIGRALRFTAKAFREKSRPEDSDADDMELLGETLFPLGYQIELMNEAIPANKP